MSYAEERPGHERFGERSARRLRNFMIGALAVEVAGAMLVPALAAPLSGLAGPEALIAAGSDMAYRGRRRASS